MKPHPASRTLSSTLARGLLATCIALFLVWGRGHAQDPPDRQATIETQASQLFNSLMSPFCPGRLLANCSSSAAEKLRNDIRTQLSEGATVEEITKALYGTYGDEIRAVPEASGFGLFAWVVPAAFFVVVALLLLLWIRSATRRPITAAEPDTELDAESAALIEEELTKVD
jgi:cytochrome c-type biogenesis protein CcmH/NrfF